MELASSFGGVSINITSAGSRDDFDWRVGRATASASAKAKAKADPPPSHPSEQKPLAGDPGSAKDDNKKARHLLTKWHE